MARLVTSIQGTFHFSVFWASWHSSCSDQMSRLPGSPPRWGRMTCRLTALAQPPTSLNQASLKNQGGRVARECLSAPPLGVWSWHWCRSLDLGEIRGRVCIAVGLGVRELRALTGRMLCTLDLRGAEGVLCG